jgi:rSAM/selenodomain-associated transferase 1
MSNAVGHLVVFARFPEPGRAKTRLIPALGAQAAAALQDQMTAHTLREARRVTSLRSIHLEVRFTGSDAAAMASRYGQGVYTEQGGGDLGMRLAAAVADTFAAMAGSVVLIGSDCPGLTADILQSAFDALAGGDMVVGPADDGGYYLLGLTRPVLQVFEHIEWGTSRVLQQTLAAAAEVGLAAHRLPTLLDLDRPEDLIAATRASSTAGLVNGWLASARASALMASSAGSAAPGAAGTA